VEAIFTQQATDKMVFINKVSGKLSEPMRVLLLGKQREEQSLASSGSAWRGTEEIQRI
jgi:hypothetical protein